MNDNFSPYTSSVLTVVRNQSMKSVIFVSQVT